MRGVPSAWRGRGTFPVLLLAAAIGFQLFTIAKDYALPWGSRVIRTWNLPAWERTALYLGGEEFAAYIGFLRQQVPEDGRVILPPRLPLSNFSYVGYVQYYLFPRDIHNCGVNEVEACVERATGSNTYILAIDDFPPVELASLHKRLVSFNDHLGVFVPR